uniref:Uncharacterized protein n=1 Tax=Drosophila-associated filamentous virus TaxID=2743186 RepID=A0A6M9TZY9_9VIRU|nr:putative protein 13 [Drosophila-associated filamentous virus]
MKNKQWSFPILVCFIIFLLIIISVMATVHSFQAVQKSVDNSVKLQSNQILKDFITVYHDTSKPNKHQYIVDGQYAKNANIVQVLHENKQQAAPPPPPPSPFSAPPPSPPQQLPSPSPQTANFNEILKKIESKDSGGGGGEDYRRHDDDSPILTITNNERKYINPYIKNEIIENTTPIDASSSQQQQQHQASYANAPNGSTMFGWLKK